MIARLIAGSCDFEGTPVGQPRARHARGGFRPTFPMDSYLTEPLSVQCASLAEVQAFLRGCTYVRDSRLHGTLDYWTPPSEFETQRRGDCDCFALWTWRRMLDLGYDARFVVGAAGLSGGCHAWVVYRQDGDWYLVEPTAARLTGGLPGLLTLTYRPRMSVAWDGARCRYFEHHGTAYKPGMGLMLRLLAERLVFQLRLAPACVFGWPRRAARWFGACREPLPEPDRQRLTSRNRMRRWYRNLGEFLVPRRGRRR